MKDLPSKFSYDYEICNQLGPNSFGLAQFLFNRNICPLTVRTGAKVTQLFTFSQLSSFGNLKPECNETVWFK